MSLESMQWHDLPAFLVVAGTIYYWAKEVVHTRCELRRIVHSYRESAEFEWSNSTPEFVEAYRIRRYESFARQLYLARPRSFAAHVFWKQVRDVVSEYHDHVTVRAKNGDWSNGEEVLPSVSFEDFPIPDGWRGGKPLFAYFHEKLMERLMQIKWLDLDA